MPPEPSQAERKEALLDAPLQALGRALVQARQSRGRSIEDQAALLHMGLEQLRALEEGNRSCLPELVFVIAQARRVASSLDLCVDGLIDDLRQAASNPSVVLADAPVPTVPERPSAEVQPSAAFIAQGSPSIKVGRLAAIAELDPPPQSSSRPARRSVPPLAILALLVAIASAAAFVLRQGGQLPLSGTRTVAAGSTSASSAPSQPARPASTGVGVSSDQLLLQTKKPSWLEVRNAKGESLHYGRFNGQLSFPNPAGLEVRAGRPDQITVVMGNAAPRTLGTIDQLDWWLIQPDGKIVPRANKAG